MANDSLKIVGLANFFGIFLFMTESLSSVSAKVALGPMEFSV